jgi:hypothetical protein
MRGFKQISKKNENKEGQRENMNHSCIIKFFVSIM